MSRAKLTATLVILCLAVAAAAGAQIAPTTTLATETGNNTAASDLWNYTANGDAVPLNVSKENIRTLLYPGFNGQVYVHLMGWFCQVPGSTATGGGTICSDTGHIQVGYNSADATQVAKQVNDMISRGVNGAIHDWYGQGRPEDDESLLFLKEAEKHPGFQLAIMIDKGVNGGANDQNVLNQMAYISQAYFPSPAYMRWNGHPVVTNFDLNVTWATVAAAYPDVIFLFQDAGGFTSPSGVTSGSYAWVMPPPYDPQFGLPYLTDFYNTGLANPSKYTVGGMYKGFNDTIAGWSGGRIMDQQCGQTWLQTFALANSMFSTTRQLPAIQLITWDDYEEGTEIETGIDNCLSVNASVAGTVLSWSLSGAGAESTIDHYHVFISTDGQNLANVGDVPAGTHQLDLAGFSIPAGNYTLFVKAVGKATIRNQMSNAVSWSLAAPTSGGGSTGGGSTGSGTGSGGSGGSTTVAGKTVAVSASSNMATMMRGQSTQVQLTVTESGAADPVSLSCSNLPAGMTCTFSPATVTPGASGSPVTLTLSMPAMMSAVHPPATPRRSTPLYALWMSGLGVAGLFTLPEALRRKRRMLLIAALLAGIVLLIACGGGGSSSSQLKPTVTTQSNSPATGASTYTVTVNATSGAVVSATNLTVTVN